MCRLRLVVACGALLHAAPATAGGLPPLPPVVWPEVPAEALGAAGFTPPGWRLEQRATGDLDGDRIADLAVILKLTDPANILSKVSGIGQDQVDTNPRLLIVAFGRAGGGYRLILANRTLIPRLDDPVAADLLEDNALAIAGGRLKLTLSWFEEFGSWNRSDTTFTFRYIRGRFELAAFDRATSARGSGNVTGLSVDYLARTVIATSGNVERDWVSTQRRYPPRGPAPTLEEIGEGLTFSPMLP